MTYGTLQRSLQLPYRVDPNQVQAWFENGILTYYGTESQGTAAFQPIQLQGRGEFRQDAKDQDKLPHNGKDDKGQEKSQEQPRS
jgi:HSP20 family protein